MTGVNEKPPIYTTFESNQPPAPQVYTSTDVERNEPPPTYDSVFGRVQRAKAESKNKAWFSYSVYTIFCQTYGCVIALCVMLALPVSMIVLGSLYFHDCPVANFIPLFLLVHGCCCFLTMCFSVYENIKLMNKAKTSSECNSQPGNSPQKENRSYCGNSSQTGNRSSCGNNPENRTSKIMHVIGWANTIMKFFILSWFIRGSVVVYTTRSWVSSPSASADFCDPTLYYYAFWVVTTTYIIFGSIFIASIIGCCVARATKNI